MLDLRRNLRNLRDQSRRCIRARVCRIYAVNIREDYERIGIDECGDDSGQIVVVPNLDLIDCNGVILVDDGNDIHAEEREECVA